MKLKTTLLAATLAAFAASTAYAGEEQNPEVKSEMPKAEAKKDVKKTVKKHSHVEEKTGMPAPKSKPGKSHRETMDKDMPMHDHTQDRR